LSHLKLNIKLDLLGVHKLNSDNKDQYSSLRFLLLSHHTKEELHRTIHLKIRGKDLYICARCSGIAIGLTIYILFRQQAAEFMFNNPMLFLLLPAPAMVDWIMQTVGLHESNNLIRIVTGCLMGMCWAGMLNLFFKDWSNVIFWLTTLIYVTAFLIVLPKRFKKLKEEEG